MLLITLEKLRKNQNSYTWKCIIVHYYKHGINIHIRYIPGVLFYIFNILLSVEKWGIVCKAIFHVNSSLKMYIFIK